MDHIQNVAHFHCAFDMSGDQANCSLRSPLSPVTPQLPLTQPKSSDTLGTESPSNQQPDPFITSPEALVKSKKPFAMQFQLFVKATPAASKPSEIDEPPTPGDEITCLSKKIGELRNLPNSSEMFASF